MSLNSRLEINSEEEKTNLFLGACSPASPNQSNFNRSTRSSRAFSGPVPRAITKRKRQICYEGGVPCIIRICAYNILKRLLRRRKEGGGVPQIDRLRLSRPLPMIDSSVESHRREHFWRIRFRGFPIQFSTKITTHLLWDVTESCTCAVIFIKKSYFQEIFAKMKSDPQLVASSVPRLTNVERIWHIYDSQGQIMALAFSKKILNPSKLNPLRSEAVCAIAPITGLPRP